MPDQEGLEAVAEVFREWLLTPEGATAIDRLAHHDPGSLDDFVDAVNVAALAASHQPVSGGPEGDVEALISKVVAAVYGDGDGSNLPDGSDWARTDREAIEGRLRNFLSRVPADGEQPAGERTSLMSPALIEVRSCAWALLHAVERSAGALVLGQAAKDLREALAASPADGPVSASRPPEAGYEQVGHINFPAESLGAGLGDRQLTAMQIDALVRAGECFLQERDDDELRWAVAKLIEARALTPRENPDHG